jgi:cytochrome c-type biogenesis protein CcmH/NrfG
LTDSTISDPVEQRPSLSELERLVSSKQLREAQEFCAQLLTADPKDHGALYWAGIIAMEYRKFPEALQAFEKAIRIDSAYPEYHANLGRALIGLKEVNAAKTAADMANALEPEDAQTLDTIGVIYSYCGDHAQAVQLFRRVVAVAPRRDSYWYNLGTSLKFAGLFIEAEQAYETALLLNPKFDKALFGLSALRKQTLDNNHIKQLKQRLDDRNNGINNELALGYALAKEYDDTGSYAEAFKTLTEVGKHYRQSISYSPEDDECLFNAMLQGFDAENVAAAKPGVDSATPIFIMGMPRTGTTLTDRIISSHSAVHAAGELQHISMLMQIAARAKSPRDFQPALIRAMLTSDLSKLGKKYLELTRSSAEKAPHFTDKMPLNVLYAGFILLAFPQAKIVCLRRNPMDSCLSNFRQLFSLDNMRYAWSYDLMDCGRYYLLFDKLMQHWNNLFPGRIHNLQYDELVNSQEQTSRKLIDYLGLDWEGQCLRFHENTAAVDTASAAQVREPMNQDGLDRWKKYSEQLQPLVEFFQANGVPV